MTTGQYTYLMVDILSNAIMAELPMYGVSLERKINGAGNMTCSMKLDVVSSTNLHNIDILGSTQPGRAALYVDRDGELVWAGPIWSRTYNSSAKVLAMTGQTFESYLGKRFLRTTKSYTGIDGRNVAIDLINTMQAVPYGNVGIQVPSLFPNTDNPMPDTTYYDYSFLKYYDIIDGLAKQNAFDWTIEPQWNAGVPQLTLRLGWPRLGVVGAASQIVFEFPGNVLQYYFSENASKGRNRSWGIGNGEGSTMLVANADDAVTLGTGYPLLEEMESYKNETVQANLQLDANSDLALWAPPVTTPTFMVRPSIEPVFGSYNIGDDINVIINDARFPQEFNGFYRMIQWNLTPSSSEAAEELNVTIGGVDGSV